jgi:hypothetical protein
MVEGTIGDDPTCTGPAAAAAAAANDTARVDCFQHKSGLGRQQEKPNP